MKTDEGHVYVESGSHWSTHGDNGDKRVTRVRGAFVEGAGEE